MRSHSAPWFPILIVGIALAGLIGCDKLHVPLVRHESPPPPRAPLSVRFIVDDTLAQATLEQTICAGQVWTGRLGDTLVKAFLSAGQKRFAEATLEPSEGSPKPAAGTSPDMIVQLRLVHKSMEAASRMGDNDYFNARINVELAVTYADGTGRPIVEAPLRHSDQYSIWTPLVGSGGTQCQTGQLDSTLKKVAEQLADGMVQTVYRVGEELQAQAQTAQAPTPSASPGPSNGAGQAGTLSIKATLLDENDNQILEGGEKVGVRVDATNQGTASMGSASVVLAGTPAVIDAFADVLASPIQVGSLQPGETKSLVFWGRMPSNAQAQRADLTVSVVLAEGGGHASQTLVAAIHAGKSATQAPAGQGSIGKNGDGRTTASMAPLDHHYAVLVGIDRYRDSSTAPSFGTLEFNAMPELLGRSGIPEDHILSLRSEQATRLDIEDTLITWLPARVTRDAIVLFYFAGRAAADPGTGSVYLIPYDGAPSGSTRRLIPLQDLQRVLAALPVRLSVLLIDAAVTPFNNPSATKPKAAKPPNWQGLLSTKGQAGHKSAGTRLIQIVYADESSDDRGTLLNWLQGSGDGNGDGHITIGEVLHSFKNGTKVYPTLPGAAPELSIPLARSTSQTPSSAR
jgi:hypothetical protein